MADDVSIVDRLPGDPGVTIAVLVSVPLAIGSRFAGSTPDEALNIGLSVFTITLLAWVCHYVYVSDREYPP